MNQVGFFAYEACVGEDWRLKYTNLAPSGHSHAEKECNKQARKRRFPGNGTDSRQWLSRLPRGRDGFAQLVNRGAKRGENFRDRARHVGRGIDGAFCRARLECRLRCFDSHGAHLIDAPRSPCAARSGNEMKVHHLGLSATNAVLNSGCRPHFENAATRILFLTRAASRPRLPVS